MKTHMLLNYNSEIKNEYEEIGYHTTYTIYKDSIIKNGFIPSNKDDEWLGEGVYFWDNENNAIWWKSKEKTLKKCMFICLLKCPMNNYLDLDKQMKEFENFFTEFVKSSAKSKYKKPVFQNRAECRKFYCDIYCSQNNIKILSFTFKHDKINEYGFVTDTIKRKQICVKSPECILITSVKE